MAIEYRTIDGSGNNLDDLTLNANGTPMVRIDEAHFDSVTGLPIDGVNTRTVSNIVVGEGDANLPNPEGVSAFLYAWGQFLDHDLDQMRSDGVNHVDITIPPDDEVFVPGSTISLTRSIVDEDGFAINNITGWLDASMVYGSTQVVADSLRLADGHLKTSDGDNLPLNAAGRFLAGDTRVQENPALTSLHTLFVREHNFQVDRLADLHPKWDGERLYQEARQIVGGEIANITYNEFLPHLLGPDVIAAYHGYDPDVDPTITEEFAGAAYRFGHSMVSEEVERIDNTGAETGPELELKDAFAMTAAQFAEFGGASDFLRALGSDSSQAMDGRIVDSLRNFLADPRGQDLAAVNMRRAEDLGLGGLNDTREALGLKPYASFEEITDDPGTLAALKDAFTDVDQVGLWIGGISENHMPDAILGETFGTIVGDQFEALRDGDRFFFENALKPKEVKEIKATTLSDIIERNTGTNVMQADAFVATERRASDVDPEDPDAPQLIIGIAGKATLIGGDKGDTLVAGIGENTMTGDDGADTFDVSALGRIQAVIVDFKRGVDQVQVGDLPGKKDTFHDLDISRNRAGDVVIRAGDDRITLEGVHKVSAADFTFAGNDGAFPSASTNQMVQAVAGFLASAAVQSEIIAPPEAQPQITLTTVHV